ncbi:MAG: sugar phosphate isomerase/epimerase [Acidobacteria bacterium]|nr:sugar phosphate isomerase/epimerase [Acidobacteriota bacterium]
MKLGHLVFLLAVPAAALAQDAALRGGNVLACETYSYRDLIREGKLDMLSVPAFYEKEGIPGISYNDMFFKSTDDAYLDQVKAAVKKAGRRVTCYVVEGNLAGNDERQRREQIELDKGKLRVAARLGAPVVRLNLGGTGNESLDPTVGVERAVAALKELLPLARQLNVKISLENHGGVTKTAANIVKVIRQSDPKWVGALVDFGNFPPADRYQEIAMVSPYAFVTHVKVNEFDDNGEARSLDFPRIVKSLKQNRYRGPISIEYEGKGDPVEGVRKTKALILKYW